MQFRLQRVGVQIGTQRQTSFHTSYVNLESPTNLTTYLYMHTERPQMGFKPKTFLL